MGKTGHSAAGVVLGRGAGTGLRLVLAVALTLTFTLPLFPAGYASADTALTATSEYNHGTIVISSEAASGTTITLGVGQTAAITVTPYQHVQYTGCLKEQCPESCAEEYSKYITTCFVEGKGCSCDKTAIVRSATVEATVDDEGVVAASDVAASETLSAKTANIGNTNVGTVTLTALAAGTAEVTVTATDLGFWFDADEVTYTVVVSASASSDAEDGSSGDADDTGSGDDADDTGSEDDSTSSDEGTGNAGDAGDEGTGDSSGSADDGDDDTSGSTDGTDGSSGSDEGTSDDSSDSADDADTGGSDSTEADDADDGQADADAGTDDNAGGSTGTDDSSSADDSDAGDTDAGTDDSSTGDSSDAENDGASSDAGEQAEEYASVLSHTAVGYREAAYGTPPDGTAPEDESSDSPAGMHALLTFSFDGAVAITDQDALLSSLSIMFNNVALDESASVASYTVEASGNDLLVDILIDYAIYAGRITVGAVDDSNTPLAEANLLEGMTAGGLQAQLEGFVTLIDTGLAFEATEVVAGTATTPASTTFTVTSSALIRSMNHVIWLTSKGSSDGTGSSIIANSGSYSQSTVAHHHRFWSFTLADSAAYIVYGGEDTLATYGYTLVDNGDGTFTITADEASEGEVLWATTYTDSFFNTYGIAFAQDVTGIPMPEATGAVLDGSDETDGQDDSGDVATDGGSSDGDADASDGSSSAGSGSDSAETASTSISGAKVTLSFTKAVYNGKVRKPTVKVVVGGVTLVKGTDYTLTYSKGCKAIGAYSVTITGTGAYSGSLAKTFTIRPAKVTLKSVKAGKKGTKKLTVKWATTAAGKKSGAKYQVAYKKKGSKGWSYKTVSAKTYKKVLKKLKKGKKYQVKVRAYKKVAGATYYGAWSKTKTVKVK